MIMQNTKTSTNKNLFRSILLTLTAVTLGLFLTASTSSAQPAGVGNGSVDWNGWTMQYGVESGSDGLRLSNVTHDNTLMLARISMPVMNVFYEIDGNNGGCGPYADLIGGNVYEGVFTNEFTQDGEQWLELAIQDTIGAYVIYQSYYFSESGVMDAHIFSRELQCNIYHEHLPFWRMDFAVEGDANDEVVRLTGNGSYVVEGNEFDFAANAAANHEWYVRDAQSGTSVRLNFDDGTYNLPGQIVPETNYIENNIYGRQYEASNPEIVWQTPPSRDLGFNDGDNIDDLVLWYTGFMPHSPEEGPDLWHSTGVRLQIVDDPEVVAPTATPVVPPTATAVVPPTATAVVPPTATTTPPTATAIIPPTPAPSGGCNFSSDFSNGPGEFVFVDNPNDPAYSFGSATGNVLDIGLGGVDNNDIFDIGAFWARSCTANNAGQVNVSVVASMTMASEYEADERAELGVTINGQSTVLAELVGNGNGGSAMTTGTQTYTFTADMFAGLNGVTLDCFNNKKTYNDETVNCRFESISVSSVVAPPTPTATAVIPPTATAVIPPTATSVIPPTPTSAPSGPIALTSGQTVSGLAGAAGDQAQFTIEVPAGSAALEVTMSGAGDADLYTLFGAIPDDDNFDCFDYVDGSSNETCTISNPPAGTHNILINGWDAFSGVSLTATVIAPNPSQCVLLNGIAETGISGSTGATFACEVAVPAGAQNFKVDMAGGGDADLYVKKGAAPTLSSYDCRPWLDGSSVESCSQPGPAAGTWYVLVNGWASYQNVSLTATWTDPAAVPSLSSGQSVLLSGSAGEEQVYSVSLPSDAALFTFYPSPLSHTCSVQMETLDELTLSHLGTKSLKVLAVSIGSTAQIESWKFHQPIDGMEMVADSTGAISNAFHSVLEDEHQVIYSDRTVFLINKEGMVTYKNQDYDVRADLDLLEEAILKL